VVFAGDRGTNGGALYLLDPGGLRTTLAADPAMSAKDFELDYDDAWVITGVAFPGGPQMGGVWTFEHTSRTLKTLFADPSNGWYNGVVIDRNPGAPTYAIAVFQNGAAPRSDPRLLAVDRNGVVNTIVSGGTDPREPLNLLRGIEFDPTTGAYLTTDASDPALSLVTPTGVISTLPSVGGVAAGARFTQDGTAWVAGGFGGQAGLMRIDMQGNVIDQFPITGFPFAGVSPSCVEVYGSRRLVCNGTGKPGSKIEIRLQSRKAGDGGKSYALALSTRRQAGIKFPSGDQLNLFPDPLFFLTVANAAPTLFANFQGTTDAFGNATAAVNLPSELTPNLGTTIFAAGIVYDSTGIRTVTNTHWFVLS